MCLLLKERREPSLFLRNELLFQADGGTNTVWVFRREITSGEMLPGRKTPTINQPTSGDVRNSVCDYDVYVFDVNFT